MQKESLSARHLSIRMDPALPVNIPYLNHLHSPEVKSASHMHWHDTLEIGLCRRGRGLFYIGNRVIPFCAGDISVIMPGVIHIAQSDPSAVSGWQFIDMDMPALVGGSAEKLRFSGILRSGENAEALSLIEKLIDEFKLDDEFKAGCVRALSCLLCAELIRSAPNADEDSPSPESLGDISPAVVHISRHYSSDLTVSALAALCSRSVASFRRVFEQTMGVPPFEFIYTVRIRAAMNLLSGSSMPVSEVAERVGYQTLSSFNRHFLRIAGCSPSAFRKQRQSDPMP